MPTLPRSLCWFPTFSSCSHRSCLAAPRTWFPHARGTESSSRGHPQPQGRAQGHQGLLGCVPSQARVPQSRGSAERGAALGLGRRAGWPMATSCLFQGHPMRASPEGNTPVQAVLTCCPASPAYPSPWLPCVTGPWPALAGSPWCLSLHWELVSAQGCSSARSPAF